MKYIKYALYVALIVVAMLLWNTWQKEHPVTSTTQQKTIETKTSKVVFHTNTNSHITKVTNQTFKSVPKNRMINVKTDVLNVEIDKVDGTLIQASLPKYPEKLKSKNPTVILNHDNNKFYIAQSGVTLNSKNISHQPIIYQTSTDHYQLQKNKNNLKVILTGKTKKGLLINKIFTFKRDTYAVNLTYQIKNNSNSAWSGSEFMQLTHSATSAKHSMFHFTGFIGAAISSPKHPYQKYDFKKLSKESIHQVTKGGWIAMVQHYFLTAWVPNKDITYRYYSRMDANGHVTVGIISPTLTIQPKKTLSLSSSLYVGPKIAKRLDQLSPKLWLTIDYGWLWFISIIILKALIWINLIIGNWGWSIIILTILIKLIFWTLSATSYKSMARMRKLQPKIARLKEIYGSDKQALSKATMELYKKEKINPMGGCLPILIQIPVFFALYYVLLESVQLRQAPWIFWIHDLSAKDPYFILPILMGISMWIQQKLNPQPADPTQAKMMLFLPIVMTVLFAGFPAGLVLYWLVNNVVSVAQQWYITKRVEAGYYEKKKGKKKR